MAHTATVGTHPSTSHALDTILLYQSAKSVKSSSRLESTNFLLILAFEEEIDFRLCIVTTEVPVLTEFAFRFSFRLRRRCDTVQCLASYNWRAVDMLLDSLVGSLD